MPTPTQRLNGLELPGIMNWQDISQQSSGASKETLCLFRRCDIRFDCVCYMWLSLCYAL